MRNEARQVAVALGADESRMAAHDNSKWLVSDTDSKRCGEKVPSHGLGDAGRSVQLGDFALHTFNIGEDDEEVVKLVLVALRSLSPTAVAEGSWYG